MTDKVMPGHIRLLEISLVFRTLIIVPIQIQHKEGLELLFI